MVIQTNNGLSVWLKTIDQLNKVLIFTVLLIGCSEPRGEASKLENEPWCANTKTRKSIKLEANLFDPQKKTGWYFAGPVFRGKEQNTPMGRYNNQLIYRLVIPTGATSVHVKVPVSSNLRNAHLIIDVIWWSGTEEIARTSESIIAGKQWLGLISSLQDVPTGADRVTLIARPWRDVDGAIVLKEGEIVWCIL